MCAWRYSAAGGSNNAAPPGSSSFLTGSGLAAAAAPYGSGRTRAGGGVDSVSIAGEYLRQNAATTGGAGAGGMEGRSLFSPSAALLFSQPSPQEQRGGASGGTGAQARPSHNDDNESYEEEYDELAVAHTSLPAGAASAGGKRVSGATNGLNPGASLATVGVSGITSAAGQSKGTVAGGGLTGATQLSRQLFRTSTTVGLTNFRGGGGGGNGVYYDDDEEDEEELEGLSAADRDFILNTRDLFEEVDPELLMPNFVPHKHVVGVIASETTGGESRPAEIEAKLEPYRELEEDINADLGTYIEHHHDEFNKAISDFSEMILAVSGSDDTLAGLRGHLTDAETSLSSHAEQLHALRLRAARSLFLSDTLKCIQDALSVESDVKSLLDTRHYLAAVQLLQKHGQALRADRISQVRATQSLREYVESALTTVHSQIIEDLLTCVFRQERLLEADAQVVQQLIDDSVGLHADGADGAAGAGRATATNDAPRNVQHTVGKYWQLPRQAATAAASNMGTTETGASAAAASTPHTLYSILDTIFDDSSDNNITKGYLQFIPLCVKSLLLLGKLDYCHEAFFSRATRSVELFIAHFLRLYDAWRRRSGATTVLSGAEGEATIRAMRVRAFDLTSETVSSEEAIARVQSRDLRALLSALFTELEKILRNADYLIKTVIVACFPFLSDFIVRPTTFDARATCDEWDITAYKFVDAGKLSGLFDTAMEQAWTTWSRARDPKKLRQTPQQGQELTQFVKLRAALNVPLYLQSRAAKVESSGALQWPVGVVSLQDVLDCLEETVSGMVAEQKQQRGEESAADNNRADDSSDEGDASGGVVAALRAAQAHITAHATRAVRAWLLPEVQALTQQWDLQVLWAQLNYHMEFVFHVLCDAKEVEEDSDAAVTLEPFLRQKNLLNRMQRTSQFLRDGDRQPAEDATMTLDRMLSYYQSGSGLLRMMEEVGPVSFSLVGAVKKVQGEARQAADARALASGQAAAATQLDTASLLARAEVGGGGVGGGGAPLVLSQASALRNWFVFTTMNALTCYTCAAAFHARCQERVPDLRKGQDASVIGFLRRYIRTNYIPALYAFHSQQLQRLCQDMGDTIELTEVAIQSAEEKTPNTGVSGVSSSAATAACGQSSISSARATTTLAGAASPLSAAWPAVLTPDTPLPVLACVYYVGRVLQKISTICRTLPLHLAEDVEENTSEVLVTELAVFLRRKVQLIGRGTIHYRVLNRDFEEAFSGTPGRRWATLCDEANLWQAHSCVDSDLYLYYRYNSSQRTSGHEYNAMTAASSTLGVLSELEAGDACTIDERVGALSPQELCLRDDGSVVALALMCYSTEWLCGAMLRALWREALLGPPGAGGGSGENGEDGAGRLLALDRYADSAVPGSRLSAILASMQSVYAADVKAPPTKSTGKTPKASGQVSSETKRYSRLFGHLSRLCALSQVSLFYLSLEARFLPFLFIPQLRDESFNVVASSKTADNFVQAYTRRVNGFYTLLRQHLATQKIKYTCLTLGKPASELVLLELAHLRDKAISEAGCARLRTDLLVMQTALQLISPTDTDVRSAVSHFFTRPALFVRYVLNRDVVNDLLSSGDYRRYTDSEVEVLIRLVFRQLSGANDDTLARQHIALYREKVATIEALRRAGEANAASEEKKEELGEADEHHRRQEKEAGSGEQEGRGSASARGSTPPLPLRAPYSEEGGVDRDDEDNDDDNDEEEEEEEEEEAHDSSLHRSNTGEGTISLPHVSPLPSDDDDDEGEEEVEEEEGNEPPQWATTALKPPERSLSESPALSAHGMSSAVPALSLQREPNSANRFLSALEQLVPQSSAEFSEDGEGRRGQDQNEEEDDEESYSYEYEEVTEEEEEDAE